MVGFVPRPRMSAQEIRAKAMAIVDAQYACLHDRKSDWRRYPHDNGQVELRTQCLWCGLTLDWLPPSEVNVHDVAAYAPFDESLAHTYHLFRREAFQAAYRSVDKQNRGEFQWWYRHVYLHTPEWRARSSAAIRRAGGLCERCRGRPATQAHHLYYGRLGHEWPEDLQALCSICHDAADHHRKERPIESPEWKQPPLLH